MSHPPTAEALQHVRSTYGPSFVAARRVAEDEARHLLDASAGCMTREQFVEMSEALRRHEVQGAVRADRFEPTFRKDMVDAMCSRLDDVNRLLGVLWEATEEDAPGYLAPLLRDHKLLPDAVPRLPTTILYLRDRDRFGYLVWSTMNGLGVALGRQRHYRDRNPEDYSEFCHDLGIWRSEWGVAPQEHDAVLSRVFESWKKETGLEGLGRTPRGSS